MTNRYTDPGRFCSLSKGAFYTNVSRNNRSRLSYVPVNLGRAFFVVFPCFFILCRVLSTAAVPRCVMPVSQAKAKCDICCRGSFPESLLACNRCITLQHTFCLPIPLVALPGPKVSYEVCCPYLVTGPACNQQRLQHLLRSLHPKPSSSSLL